MKIDLQTRDLKTGSTAPKAFDSLEDCKAWLAARPQYTEVLGIASHHVPAEVSDELKALRRPLDAEEQKLADDLDAAMQAARDRAAAQRRREEEAAAERHRQSMENADPGRPLTLRYLYNRGVVVADNADKRVPSQDVLAAIKEWVEERNTWVESRNQVVGDATITVHPGDLAEGQERIISGTFIPVSAPRS
ncbi:MAG: hypothetical protein KC731_19125 [Myxococcales bacterium]|nr:hypothetical protein [Myxococcales bacterium]